ncbi:MAG: DUF1905 domain-containing protein [Rhizorhabdus sp.]
MAESFTLTSTIWLWKPPAGDGKNRGSWHFLTIDGQTAAEIGFAALGRTAGFGSIKVEARIGGTAWSTSIFPQRASGGFILPLKADVRKREAIGEGDTVVVTLTI